MTLPSLRLLARGLLGRDLVIQPGGSTASKGLPSRPVLTPTHWLLPNDLVVPDEIGHHQLCRAALAHAVAHLKHSTPSVPAAGLKPMTVVLMSSLEDARVERLLWRDHPGLRAWFLPPLRLALQPDGVGLAPLLSRLDLALMDPAHEDDHPWVHKARVLFEAQADTDLGHAEAFRQIAMTLVHDLGQTRVAFSPGQYHVSAPYRDDHTFLWHHEVSSVDPPPELALHVPQSRPPEAQSLKETPDEQAASVDMAEVALSQHLYPEWDHRLSLLRPDWCTVIEKRPHWRPWPRSAQTVSAMPLALKPSFKLNGGRRIRRQPEGDDLDLNAAVAFMVDHRAQRFTEPRYFTRRAAANTSASILVLLDLSESTNDVWGDGPESFLDLEKSAALMLADAVHARGDRMAVHGFSSNTRAEVSHYRLIDFGMPIDAASRTLLSSAPGRHSTRLGAALRHATTLLADETTDLKAILVLTDGAPSDIDVHRPQHLVEDARHAVHAARAAGVQVHGLVVDRQADTCAHRIFGGRHHQIVDQASALPQRLCGLYRWLAA